MRRASWLVGIASGLGLVQNFCVSLAAASSKFTFDGSSSDMAQQFRDLYDLGTNVPALSLNSIPSDIQTRLSNYSLEFADLPPLLQRAVLWDSGYVVTYGDDTKLSTIYTMCDNAMTMADIALPLAQFQKPGCVVRNCTNPSDNTTPTYRSLYCTGTQMASVSLCAASDAGDELDSSMWATGGSDALLPLPTVVTHKWSDSVEDYLIYAIHMVSREHSYASCPIQASDSAMIVPCVPYANVSTQADWCRPNFGKVVDNWLSETPAGGTSSSTSASSSSSTLTPSTVAPSTGTSPTSSKTTPRSHPTLSLALQSLVDSAPTYDGTSSDLALQYLVRYAQGDVAGQLDLEASSLPNNVQTRLSVLGLKFEDLDGLLQRALIWDSGYVLAAEDGKTFVKIYTKADKSMAQIVLPQAAYENGGCSVKTCADGNGGYSNRSYECNGDQMAAMVNCASGDVADSSTHTSMWASGGSATDIPTPQVIRHSWMDASTSYLILAIHTGPEANEPAWDQCTTDSGFYGAMIVPCRPYSILSNTSKSDWATPTTGAVVSAWLVQAQRSKSGIKWSYILLIWLALVVVVSIVVSWWRRKKSQAERSFSNPIQELQVMSPINNGDAASIKHDYSGLKTDAELNSSDDRTLTTGSLGSSGERDAANDAIRFLQEDSVLTRSRIPLEALQFTRILAKGGFGEVWMGYHQFAPVAIKKLLSSKLQIEPVPSFIEEIKLTSSLDHPNIIRFVGVAWTKLDNLCMVIEYLETGDLQNFLASNNTNLTWTKDKFLIALGIAKAILYLHARRPVPLIHRDIKAKNILLTTNLQPKLIDFGVSRDSVQETMTAGIGTPYWAAPEVLEGNRYTEQSDIYSFGILLSELDTAQIPFSNVRSSDGSRMAAFQILNLALAGKLEPTLSSQCPPAIATMMRDCLRLDSTQRPTALLLVDRLECIVGSAQSIEPALDYVLQGDSEDATF